MQSYWRNFSRILLELRIVGEIEVWLIVIIDLKCMSLNSLTFAIISGFWWNMYQFNRLVDLLVEASCHLVIRLLKCIIIYIGAHV